MKIDNQYYIKHLLTYYLDPFLLWFAKSLSKTFSCAHHWENY